MKVTSLAGGVGGAKLLIGLQTQSDLTAVVNTGDDATIYGVHVSPDVDIVTYWLAGIADTERGWGIAGDTFTVVAGLRELGVEAWFSLGDRDFATCLLRTMHLRSGATLSGITDEIRRARGVQARVIPMSDDPVRTQIVSGTRKLDFQEYFVKERCEPEISEILLEGIADAKPAPGVLDAIAEADCVVLCPSNPIVSVGPILALPGIREALRQHPRVIAVTPIVRGAPVKGPADKLLAAAGSEVSASGVAALYSDFCDAFVVDASDPAETQRVAALGIRPIVLDTMMTDHAASTRLARELLSA